MPNKDSKYGNGLLPPDKPPASRFPHVKGYGEAEVRLYPERVKKIFSDWWPEKGFSGNRVAKNAVGEFYANMAQMQEELIRAHFPEMDDVTQARAASTIMWLHGNPYPGSPAEHLEGKT